MWIQRRVEPEVVCGTRGSCNLEFALLPEGSDAWPKVIDHLLERVRQARAGESAPALTAIVEPPVASSGGASPTVLGLGV